METSHSFLVQLIACIIMFVGIFILAPILSFCWMKFLRVSKSVTMKHKNVQIINWIIMTSMFGLIIEVPLIISCTIWNVNSFTFILSLWMISAINSIYICIIFLLYSIHLWLLFYYKQYHIAIAEIAWKKAINARYRSWYILNKSKWGNFNYIIKIMSFPFILYIFIQFGMEYMLFIKGLLFDSIILLSILFLIPSFSIYCKLKKYNDIFNIKKEVKYQCIITVIFMIIYLSVFTMETLTDFIIADNNNSDLKTFTFQIGRLLLSLTTIIVIFTMSFILISSHCKSTPIQKDTMDTFSSAESTNNNNISNININAFTMNSINHGVQGMLEVIADNQGFKQYMQHLVRYREID